jgi:YYY domain-containing protein
VTQTLRFLALLEALSLVGAPLAARAALSRLPGAGLGFAKLLAWLLLAWVVWMLGSLGLPHGLALVLVCAAALAGLAFWLHRRGRAEREPDPFARRLFIATEALFALAFVAGVVLISYNPIVWGTEKPMDMMLVNATLVDSDLPPRDPWLSGTDVNYYYLGHHMAGLLIRLTGVEPSEGYNLALAAFMAIIVSTAFALAATMAEAARRQGARIRRPLLAGALCVVLLALMGSWRGGWSALATEASRNFDWFAPSRVIPNTINEVPVISWIVGDLHAHFMAVPLTLLALAFIVQAGLYGPPRLVSAETFCAALSIGWLYAVNSWSWPVMVGVLLLAVGVWMTGPDAAGLRRRAIGWAGAVVAVGVVTILPFVLGFEPNVNDDQGSFLAFTKEAQREELWTFVKHHLEIEGPLLWLLVAPLVARLLRARHPLRIAIWGAGALALALAVLSPSRLGGAAITAALLAATLAAAAARRLRTSERMLWVIAAAGLACILGAELGVVRDAFYGSDPERMNTVFKMGYQAWILLAVFGAVALAAAREWSPGWYPRTVWALVAAFLVGVSMAYPAVATYSRMHGFTRDPGLDGRRWLEASAPGDPAAIDWIREELPGDAVILEAVGDDYSEFGNARISTYTGRPTIIGWQGHELQWSHDVGRPRGEDPRPLRRDDVQTLYTSQDEVMVRDLLDLYGVDYAVIGPLERTTYGTAGIINGLGETVFEAEGTRIVKL